MSEVEMFVEGMVQVANEAFRIAQLDPDRSAARRGLDSQVIGIFPLASCVALGPLGTDADRTRETARRAVQVATTRSQAPALAA